MNLEIFDLPTLYITSPSTATYIANYAYNITVIHQILV